MLSLNRPSSLPLPLERGGGRVAVTTYHIFLALFILGAVIRLTGLNIQSLGFDELWGVGQARLPMGEMITHLAEHDVQPPAFALLQWGWMRMFPLTETWLRLLPALLGILAIPLAHAVARRLFGSTVALIATAFIVIHPFLVEYAQEARNYSLLQVATLLSLLMLLQWADKPDSTARMVFYILAAALLPYTHAHGALVLVAQCVWVMLSMPRLRQSYWIPALCIALLFLPWMLNFALQIKGVLEKQSFVSNADLVTPTFSLMLHWFRAWGGYEVITGSLLFLLAAWGLLMAEGRTRSLLFCLLVIPVFLPLVISLFSGPIIHVKCGITIVSVLCIAAAYGVSQLPPMLSALFIFGITGVQAWHLLDARQAPRHEQYRELAALARQDHAFGAVVIAESHLQNTLGFYLEKTDFVHWLNPEQNVEKFVQEVRKDVDLVTYLTVRREVSDATAKVAAMPALARFEVPFYRAKAIRLRLAPPEKAPAEPSSTLSFAEAPSPVLSPTEMPVPTVSLPSLFPKGFEDFTMPNEVQESTLETPGVVTLPAAVPAAPPAPNKLIAPKASGKTSSSPVKAGRNN